MSKATLDKKYTPESVLYLALELGNTSWNLGFSIGLGRNPRQRKMVARDLDELRHEIGLAKKRFGLPAGTVVKSCYEAGRDGFWIHRALEAMGVENQVVDSASIEVNRRARRAKTDNLDVVKLLSMLIRYHNGEESVWSVVRVPTEEEEDQRHLHRQMLGLKTDRTRHINRLKSLLVSQGIRLGVGVCFSQDLQRVRLWDGTTIPPGLMCRLEGEYASLGFVQQRIRELEKKRQEELRHSDTEAIKQVRQLMRLRGIGVNGAWLFVMEFFAWRRFHNRREVGALTGLTPTPYQSGAQARERGISKSGNRHIRAMAIEIAWSWLRYQPNSELFIWYYGRYAKDGKRQRKIGIVALARKLLIAIWHYLETGLDKSDNIGGVWRSPRRGHCTNQLSTIC